MTLEKQQRVIENMRTVLENMKSRYAPRDDGLDLRTADADGHSALVDAFLKQETGLEAARATANELRAKLSMVSVDLRSLGALRKWLNSAGCSEEHVARIESESELPDDNVTPRELSVVREILALRQQLAAANETTKKLETKLRSAEDERCAALHEMARARKKADDCLDSAQQANGILGLEAYNRGGQFARMYEAWRVANRTIAAANETIAQLRQRDTVRPTQVHGMHCACGSCFQTGEP